MVVRNWWIGLADDECGGAWAGACQLGLAGCQPFCSPDAALISHDGRCQFVFCLEHRKLNNPSKCGYPFFLCIYSQNPLTHSHCGWTIKTQLFPDSSVRLEGKTKGSVIEARVSQSFHLTVDEFTLTRKTSVGWTLFICVLYKGKRDELSKRYILS